MEQTFKSTNTVIPGPDISLDPIHVDFTGSSAHVAVVRGTRYRMFASQACFVWFLTAAEHAAAGDITDETDAMPVTEESAEYILATGDYLYAIGRAGVTSGYVHLTPLAVSA